MKKIIGILGVAVIAATLFFTTDVVNNTSTDTSLGSLITMNTANATEWNTGLDLLKYGATKDEKNVPQDCPSETSSSNSVYGGYGGVTAGYNNTQTATYNTTRTHNTCANGGSINCDPTDC